MSHADAAASPAAPIADPIPGLREDKAARARMGRNRRIATGLLGGMGAVFLGSWWVPAPGLGTALLRAGAEAGIVGGLADWFAVTALFRHPLGLPIPHTAVLPRNKERIGRALAGFVERGFLTEEALLPRLRALGLGGRLATWLSRPDNARALAGPVAAALPQTLRAVEQGPLRDFLTQVVGDRLRRIDFAPIVGRVLDVLTTTGEGDILFEKAIGFLLGWLDANRGEIDRLVAQRSRWWVPASLDRRIASTIVESIAELLHGLHQPDSGTRQRLREALAGVIHALKNEPDNRLEWEAARNRLLAHPELQAWLNAVWGELSAALSADLADPGSRTRAVLENAFTSVGTVLAGDAGMQARIDALLERLALRLLVHRAGVSAYMTDVVAKWDARTLADRLELVIGSDLQFIRMNGTVVGFLVGCGLFGVSRLLGG